MIQQNQCRLTNHASSLTKSDFNRLACANCYSHLEFVLPGFEKKFDITTDGYLESLYDNSTIDLNSLNDTQKFKEKIDTFEFSKWNACCQEAKKCCYDIMSNSSMSKINFNNSCENVWDGWSCHMRTVKGGISRVACPQHMSNDCSLKLNGKQFAQFECTSDGWFKNNDSEWADYSYCLNETNNIKQRLIYTSLFIHSISLVMLLLGLMIFSSYRKLKVNRIKLHKHLFASLLFNSIMQFIWELNYNLNEQKAYCIPIYVFLHYSRSTNYFWMFSESFYLHKLLANVFVETKTLLFYYLIGWGAPLILVTVFISCNLWKNAGIVIVKQNCWVDNYELAYVFMIPNIIILIINSLFLINIIRLIYTRLNYSNEQNQFSRIVKSALILIPLFGIHFILSPFVMCDAQPGTEFYNMFNVIIENSNGIFVSLIYCFLNKEVTTLLKSTVRKIARETWSIQESSTVTYSTNQNQCERFINEPDIKK